MTAEETTDKSIVINTRPWADRYSGPHGRVIEYSSPSGSGRIVLTEEEGKLIVDLYRHDDTVEFRVRGRAG